MPVLRFDFCGSKHELRTFDDPFSVRTATDIVKQLAYRFPDDAYSANWVRSVVDLGAHVGEFTIMAAAYWPKAVIHAFEPNPQVIPLLRQNCQRYSNIVIHELGVGTRPGRGQFFLNSISSVAAASYLPHVALPGVNWTPVEVDYAGPEDILNLAPDVMKIDIEGTELAFVSAAMPGIERASLIYVEFHGEDVRVELDRLLLRTHSLCYARITRAKQGELTYLKRNKPLF